MSVWEKLVTIDCSEHIEKKGKFNYLSWAWAWAAVKNVYPESKYHLEDDVVYPDGTMEVRCSVCIGELCHTMWLPVTDYQNNPISSPNAFDINTARMRCLVKCLAMFGLGHYIYAGEDLPKADPYTPEQLAEFKTILANENGPALVVFLKDAGEAARDALFNSAPQGEKTRLKERCRALHKEGIDAAKKTVEYIRVNIAAANFESINEAVAELSSDEHRIVFGMLDEIEKQQITEAS